MNGLLHRFHQRRHGFTLIELLSAMAILIVITLFVGRLFTDAAKLWKLGTRRVNNAVDGRAVIDFMVRELSGAIADGTLVMHHKVDADKNVLGMNCDRIYFVTTDQIAQKTARDRVYRQVKQVSYHIAPMLDLNNNPVTNRFRIVRNGVENSIGSGGQWDCYTDTTWWDQSFMNDNSESGSSVTLAENVRTLEFWIYDRNGNLIPGVDYDSAADGPPAWIEIYIEMLGEDDAIKAAVLCGSTQPPAATPQVAIDYADRSSRRYVGRVYINNGPGYAPDN